MEFFCPHCCRWFAVKEPFEFLGDQKCPLCNASIYVEVDESEEGPTFATYKEMPRC